MKDINIIQYLPLTHPRATLRFVKKFDAAGVMSILDLEDSAQDPFDEEKTKDLKLNARNNFFELVNSKTWNGDEFVNPIYVRVNSRSTEFFKEDIETVLKIFRLGFPISGIFLPKVESYEQVKETYSLLNDQKNLNNKRGSLEIVPMIETIAGMEGLELLLKSDQNENRFSKVHYGHFDYCLDAKLWPFPDPVHDSFWNLIEPMVRIILEYNKTYIHTPFPFPKDIDLFWASSRHLTELFSIKDIWICTLNSELSLSGELIGEHPLKIHTLDASLEFMINEARIIQENFLAGRANKRSFRISNNRFIPPHQYFAAEQYLKNIKKG